MKAQGGRGSPKSSSLEDTCIQGNDPQVDKPVAWQPLRCETHAQGIYACVCMNKSPENLFPGLACWQTDSTIP